MTARGLNVLQPEKDLLGRDAFVGAALTPLDRTRVDPTRICSEDLRRTFVLQTAYLAHVCWIITKNRAVSSELLEKQRLTPRGLLFHFMAVDASVSSPIRKRSRLSESRLRG